MEMYMIEGNTKAWIIMKRHDSRSGGGCPNQFLNSTLGFKIKSVKFVFIDCSSLEVLEKIVLFGFKMNA